MLASQQFSTPTGSKDDGAAIVLRGDGCVSAIQHSGVTCRSSERLDLTEAGDASAARAKDQVMIAAATADGCKNADHGTLTQSDNDAIGDGTTQSMIMKIPMRQADPDVRPEYAERAICLSGEPSEPLSSGTLEVREAGQNYRDEKANMATEDDQSLPETPIPKPTSIKAFDLESFRVPQDFASMAQTRDLLMKIPVRKPGGESFFRTHPKPDYRITMKVIELKEEGEYYLVARELWPALEDEASCVTKLLVPAINMQQVLFLWPIGMPDQEGRLNGWHESAHEAADAAKSSWIRLKSNKSLGAYQIKVAEGNLPDPIWPEKSLGEMIDIGFRGKIIDALDHPVLRKLRGEI